MRILPLLLFSLIMACSTGKKEKDNTTVVQKQDTLPVKNRVIKEIPEKEWIRQRDSLLENFEYKRGDFSVPTYYHKNWWGKYTIRDHALTAGIDSTGNCFLVANSYEETVLILKDYGAAEVNVFTGDSVFSTNRAIENDENYFLSKGVIEKSVVPGAWNPVVCVYMNGADNGVIKKIAENYDQPVKFCLVIRGNKASPVFSLSKRDKKGIKDCHELSVLIRKLNSAKRSGSL